MAFARPDRQLIVSVEVDAATRLDEAIRLSGILAEFPDIDLDTSRVGVFGKLRKMSDTVCPGDRIEIYRPLLVDPKDVRRRRAQHAR